MHPTARTVADAARALGLEIKIVEFDQVTRTAEEAASAIGCHVAQIVKSLVFVVDEQAVVTLVSGSNRLDDRKLARLRGVSRKKVKRASAQRVKEATGFTIGGVPPMGHKSRLPLYVDADLMRFEVVWAAAGTPHAVFAIGSGELAEVTGGIVADLKVDA